MLDRKKQYHLSVNNLIGVIKANPRELISVIVKRKTHKVRRNGSGLEVWQSQSWNR